MNNNNYKTEYMHAYNKCTYSTTGGARNLACCTKYIKHTKCTANCNITVNIVYTLKIFGKGLCFDKTFNGCKKQIFEHLLKTSLN